MYLKDLIKKNVFESAYPLHEDSELRTRLNLHWATWKKCCSYQPINDIRQYFGEKVALYFAWLGWYTVMLIPAALVGLIVFLYGLVYFDNSKISEEICNANTTIMCPLCDQKCPFWLLSETCTYAKVTHLFDNEGTVFFALFMALWATVFLELWKRARARNVCDWDLFFWDEDEEEIALDLINDPNKKLKLYQHSYPRIITLMLLVAVMIAVLIGLTHAIVVYRVWATMEFTKYNSSFLKEHANTAAVITGAVLHYIAITVMTEINKRVSLLLCKLEQPRTESAHENNFTVKMFTFQFFTLFSSLIYIAFFLGRINGHPGSYVRIAGQWRLEECHPSGCITDLFIQLCIIMVLKQTVNNVFEYTTPWLRYKYRKLKDSTRRSARVHSEDGDTARLKAWLQKNEMMNNVGTFSLFNEFLEMVIQYSFTTIFVAAFPLAPLLALLNNIIEIRLDAIKMLRFNKRIVPKKVNDIGIWLQVLEAIGVLAVIGNALVIAITSDFIPRLVYKFHYGPCGTQNNTDVDCMTGYINNTLSVFFVKDFEKRTDIDEALKSTITYCRYRDYRNQEDYRHTVQFWHIFAARLAFVILFEHVAVCIKFIAAWFVPDVPRGVNNTYLESKHERLQLIILSRSTDV
ncbi:anoctamin-9 [Protopterus annectens]|uniref:anoctamin-9 n=1 Tax=Protopterus annectens TaxID=7888 RepID=UPI001CFB274F|nr:anoctamin-9 [Protopterus annectens]